MTRPAQQLMASHDGMTWFGLYPAVVKALEGDPTGAQRIEVEFTWLPAQNGGGVRAWAEPIVPYADAGQGFRMLPEIDSTVVVGFWSGNVNYAYIVGATWNGNARMPEAPDDDNNLRLIASRSGSRLQFDDTPGGVQVQITSGGAPDASVNTITLDESGHTITIAGSGGATVTLTASGDVEIDATQVRVTAANVTVDAPMSRFTGVVQCETLIATGGGVISPSYTPGAGNVW